MTIPQRSQGDPIIEIDGVVVAVDDVVLLPPTSASVSAREALVVRGHNGAGKSTLLKVVAGLRVPTGGTVAIGGEPVDRRNRTFRRRVASMLTSPPTAPDLTVEDHVRVVAATWFRERGVAEETAIGVLAELGLHGLHRRFPHELSSGQQQLFALALVLARPFDVLVLDEPEQRLDADRVAMVGDVLARRRDDGAALVIATHSQTLTERISDRVLELDRAT